MFYQSKTILVILVVSQLGIAVKSESNWLKGLAGDSI